MFGGHKRDKTQHLRVRQALEALAERRTKWFFLTVSCKELITNKMISRTGSIASAI